MESRTAAVATVKTKAVRVKRVRVKKVKDEAEVETVNVPAVKAQKVEGQSGPTSSTLPPEDPILSVPSHPVDTKKASRIAGYRSFAAFLLQHGLHKSNPGAVEEGKVLLRKMGFKLACDPRYYAWNGKESLYD